MTVRSIVHFQRRNTTCACVVGLERQHGDSLLSKTVL